MHSIKPTPEAIAALLHANAVAWKAGVLTHDEHADRQVHAWNVASRHRLTEATVRALATIEATDDGT